MGCVGPAGRLRFNKSSLQLVLVLTTSAKRAEERKHAKCRQRGLSSPSRSRRWAGTVPLPRRCTSSSSTKQLRDSGLPADVLVSELKKDISFTLRRSTIAQVTTALDAA